VGDDVREVTNPDKVGSGPMSGRYATWGNIYGYRDFLFIYSPTELQPEPIFAHNSSKDAVWCEKNPYWDEKCVILKFGGCFTLKTPLKLVAKGNYQPK